MGLSDDILQNDVISTHGRDYTIKIIREFAQGDITARFINLHFCHGCIDGPVIDNELSGFRRKELVSNYARSKADPAQTEKDIQQYAGIDLSRKFTVRSVGLATPGDKDVQSILQQMHRANPEDQFNCGACGYSSCRELAVAVCQGLAEVDMCWPYLFEKLKTTQEDLIQAEKLTSLGQLAASIAHEINNPLAGVLTYTKLLARKVSGDTFEKEEALGYLAKMESEVSRCSRIIRNLLDFSRQTEPHFKLVDINQILEQVLAMVGHQAQIQKVEIVKEFSSSLPEVMADFDQLQQVFTNLTLNAIQAMSGGGKLTLRTSVANSQVEVDVQDTGCGISKENLSKLFTPFFTTKEKGKGVGLGLAVVQRIIERHKGRIQVQSEVGKGTTFSIYLRAHDGEKGQNTSG